MSGDIQRISEALHFTPASDREHWVRMGMAIKSELGDSGFDLWEEWSQRDDSFDAAAARDVWKSIRAGGKVTIGTLFHEAKAQGWRDDGGHQMPAPEEIAERRRIAAERAASEEAEIARERANTKKLAMAIVKASTEAKADNPYLVLKELSPVATLREIDADKAAAILGYVPKSGGVALTGRLLVAQVKQGDGLSTVELIDGAGRKTALSGRGTKAGGYWATERLPDGGGVGLALLIGEGVATVLSAKKATGHPAIAALSSGNLPTVAKAMRALYPEAEIVILADLVKATGEPDPHAIEAAQVCAGRTAIPDFGPDRDPDMKDMNDLMILDGTEAVKRAIAGATAQANPDAQAEPESAPEANASGWYEPRTLTVMLAPEPYPLDALPASIRAAIEEVAGFVKAPIPLVAMSALAAISLATQAHFDIKRADKLDGPIGLFIIGIADSGERKSTCDGYFTKPIRDYESAQAEAAKPIIKDYNARLEAWEARRGGIKEQIRSHAKGNKPTAQAETALRDLEHERPEPPRVPRLLYADATPEALAFGLGKGWPSGGVVSAEAGIVFGSHGMGKDSVMRNLAMLNQLWDGNSLTIDRRTTDSFTVKGARLTVALQIQEPTLREFFTKSGALARGTGFLARFLVSWPESTQGFRPFTEPPANWPHLAAFHRRITEILEQPVPIGEDGALTPAMLTLTPDAKAAWVEYHDLVERELAGGGELYDVRDVASKSADNAARLAALFQIFQHGAGGAVGADCFESASQIAAWHLGEARRFFGELALPTELADAARLDAWLIEHCRRERTHMVSTRDTQQFGPVRDKEKMAAALRELEELDRVRVTQEGRRRIVKLNPALIAGKA